MFFTNPHVTVIGILRNYNEQNMTEACFDFYLTLVGSPECLKSGHPWLPVSLEYKYKVKQLVPLSSEEYINVIWQKYDLHKPGNAKKLTTHLKNLTPTVRT